MNIEDVDRAYDEWGANCGPAAVAEICGLSLDDVRSHFEGSGFADKRYTNPTMMLAVLRSLQSTGVSWRSIGASWPRRGLVRIQWGGRWMREGVPIRARYRHTHWIATMDAAHGRGIFDINAVGQGACINGWTTAQAWEEILVPWLTKGIAGSDGTWSLTHGIEVAR